MKKRNKIDVIKSNMAHAKKLRCDQIEQKLSSAGFTKKIDGSLSKTITPTATTYNRWADFCGSVKFYSWLAMMIFLLWASLDYLGGAVINSNKENCNALGMHLGAEKYEWISPHGCWIDGKRYYL